MNTLNYFKYVAIAVFITIPISENFSQNKKVNTETQEKINNGVMIPTAGNSWVISPNIKNSTIIGSNGIELGSPSVDTIRTFFHINKEGGLDIGIRAKANNGDSKIKMVINGQEVLVPIETKSFSKISVGKFYVTEPGYQQIDIIGTPGAYDSVIDISHVIVADETSADELVYVKEDFYWGRRGPSVHLRYEVPEDAISPIRYFYNEITVPEGEDVLGSYFMANGFGQGYFGIQVNSETERRILFSVWSPFHTDNPEEIPENMRIKLLKKGEGVHAGKFGNEGSGGQSYKKFMWKAGVTYGFLLKGEPTGNNSTRFTAWFFDPQEEKWALIASFERPETNTYLTGLHSFLENFRTETGFKSRKVYYSNQWMVDNADVWHRVIDAEFSADSTARKKARLDYSGGAERGRFFLENCGFFDDGEEIGAQFFRKPLGMHPKIDFDKLP